MATLPLTDWLAVLFALPLLIPAGPMCLLPIPPLVGQITAYDLARIAEGEAGGWGVWGNEEAAREAQRHVMWVARNRLRSPQFAVERFAADYNPLDGFFGAAETASPEGEELALEVLLAEQKDDPTGGMFYVLSAQDRERLSFPHGDLVLTGARPFALHLYREWPG